MIETIQIPARHGMSLSLASNHTVLDLMAVLGRDDRVRWWSRRCVEFLILSGRRVSILRRPRPRGRVLGNAVSCVVIDDLCMPSSAVEVVQTANPPSARVSLETLALFERGFA